MSKPTMTTCKTCGAEIATSAKSCPKCGAKNKKKHPVLGGILIALGVIILISAIFGTSGTQNEQLEQKNDTTVNNPAVEEDKTQNVTENDVFENSNIPQTSSKPTPEISLGKANAMLAAERYLSFMAFSRDGLIRQLEFEKYSTEDATYAVDNCGADWNEQALKKAKNYLDTMAFSYSGLVWQLEFEGFTSEQADYAVQNCGADWNEQAALKAKSYLDMMSFSREGLIDQLEFEGFTYDQAVFGVTQVGY